jgi:hypothetical protein
MRLYCRCWQCLPAFEEQTAAPARLREAQFQWKIERK